jgi:hypothetical protein
MAEADDSTASSGDGSDVESARALEAEMLKTAALTKPRKQRAMLIPSMKSIKIVTFQAKCALNRPPVWRGPLFPSSRKRRIQHSIVEQFKQ